MDIDYEYFLLRQELFALHKDIINNLDRFRELAGRIDGFDRRKPLPPYSQQSELHKAHMKSLTSLTDSFKKDVIERCKILPLCSEVDGYRTTHPTKPVVEVIYIKTDSDQWFHLELKDGKIVCAVTQIDQEWVETHRSNFTIFNEFFTRLTSEEIANRGFTVGQPMINRMN
jgi:hypothetical protein